MADTVLAEYAPGEFLRRAPSPPRAARRGRRFFPLLLLFLFAFLPLSGQKEDSLEDSWLRFKAADVHFARGRQEFTGGRLDKAAAAFRECLRAMPGHAQAHYYLANISYIGSDYREALAQMEMALADFDLVVRLDDYSDRIIRKDIESAGLILDSEWGYSPDCRTSRELEEVAGQLFDEKSGLADRAAKRRKARTLQKAHYLYFTGNVLFQLKRFPEALKRYWEAIEVNPRHAGASNNAAAICLMAGQPGTALSLLEAAERQGLEDSINLKLKHLVYKALDRPTEGILQEEVSAGAPEGGLGVMRFALAIHGQGALQPVFYENCYVVYDPATKAAVVIDPGVEDPRVGDFVRSRGLAVAAVLNTHGHSDHAGADRAVAAAFHAPVWAPKKDAGTIDPAPDRLMEGGETLKFGGLSFKVIRTPGHSAGSVCFLAGDYLFSGDTLFRNDIGRVPAGDSGAMAKARQALIREIRENLLTLAGGTRVCPGHGKTSTIDEEIAANPFLKG